MTFNCFEQAQAKFYSVALQELTAGKKKSHWMWFVFPQLEGLGQSEIAQKFALEDGEHAREYLAHPILGKRLLELTQVCCNHKNLTAADIFDHDTVKFHSCMTLFALTHPDNLVFKQALHQFFAGRYCQRTWQILKNDGVLD
ncbi:DUF1810 domain-containing protein [Thalassotalea castellviae]|uniref:DUF1810 family protein n=1 Tax=Thalassotalea castellviae TaxID=3075612 RepID=A0ABU3A2C1_9GAMM|nr:DUF1810 family protein [Thalassotalea sp. W431]MDT0604331.1 DUF1810 family protein [Thalassotalea sp. W431]